ncbi:MAG: hypothetical protein SPJ86_02475, partial [Eubacteriales bacterium]|nr:hypothetical protein [Eubacteriales bacterium]
MQSVLKKIAIFVLALALIAAFGCKGDTPPTQTDEQGMQTTNPPGQTAPQEAEAPDIGEAVASLFGSIENIEKYDGENAVSAVGSLVIESGSFVIPYCYEGLEATSVTIRSGSIDIIS